MIKVLSNFEKLLFQRLIGANANCAAPFFIVGAPRTGSTFCYQLLASSFDLPYFSNITNNYFSNTPLVGLVLQSRFVSSKRISFSSRYGKSFGLFQPSEASAIMRFWFGGGHPSELLSYRVKEIMESHLQSTFSAAEVFFGKPMLIKNAWNCFRINYLANAFPDSKFLWLRRDIEDSAKSDLAARYAVHGNPFIWNSATPRNLCSLQLLPYWAQVVENQYEFSRAISVSLSTLHKHRFKEIWYEDLVKDPTEKLLELKQSFPSLLRAPQRLISPRIVKSSEQKHLLTRHDEELIEEYIKTRPSRFLMLKYKATSKPIFDGTL